MKPVSGEAAVMEPMARSVNGEAVVMEKIVSGEAMMARLVSGEAEVAPKVNLVVTLEVADITIKTTEDLMAKWTISRLFKTLLSESVVAKVTIEEVTEATVVEEEVTEEVIKLSIRAS